MDIAAQHHMILDASAFRDCRPLRVTLLATPFVGSSLFSGQFQSSVEEATHSQEKLRQVRRLASAGSKAAQGSSSSRAPPQSKKRRAISPPPPPPTAQSVPSGDRGLAAKSRRSKNGGNNRRSGGGALSLRLSRVPGGRGSPTTGLPPGAVDDSTPSLPPIPPTLGVGVGLGWMGRPFWTFLGWCGIHSLELCRKVSSLWAAGCRFSSQPGNG